MGFEGWFWREEGREEREGGMYVCMYACFRVCIYVKIFAGGLLYYNFLYGRSFFFFFHTML